MALSTTAHSATGRNEIPNRGDFVAVGLKQLRVGSLLRSPIYDARPESATLLLSSGSSLTSGQLAALRRRGITSVLVHQSELERVTATPTMTGKLTARERDELRQIAAKRTDRRGSVERTSAGWRITRDSFLHSIQTPPSLDRNAELSREFENHYQSSVSTTTSLYQELVSTESLNTRQVNALTEHFLADIKVEFDEFVSRSILPIVNDYPSRHGTQTAMLALAMGSLMGLSKTDLQELAFGCLLHDSGMLLIPKRLHQVSTGLSISDRLELQKHPILASDLLASIRDVPHGAKMVVYQMHERMNGTGYPRQRQGTQIHQLARIAAVADCYLAMVSPRAFRTGLEPYHAMEKMLFATRQGLFDPGAVRALLHAVGLFPIGSAVRLNDGRVARITRSNRDAFERPVVELIQLTGSIPQIKTLDLRDVPELMIVGTCDPSEITPPTVASTVPSISQLKESVFAEMFHQGESTTSFSPNNTLSLDASLTGELETSDRTGSLVFA
jgi:HD-GYP domain-containing protein (c-di-GMP phosphodiesterase class II)